MITVYVWNQQHGGALGALTGDDDARVGHAAMEISGGPGEPVYVSWWPRYDSWGGIFNGPADRRRNLEMDFRAEGGFASHHHIVIPGVSDGEGVGLDETAMKKWWTAWQRNSTYRLLDRNCSTAVVRGLLAGGAMPYANQTLYINSDAIVWSPSDVVAIAQACVTGIGPTRHSIITIEVP